MSLSKSIILKAESKQATWIFNKKKKLNIVSVIVNGSRNKVIETRDEEIAREVYNIIKEYVTKNLGDKSLNNISDIDRKDLVSILKDIGGEIKMEILKKEEFTKSGVSVRLIELEKDKHYIIRYDVEGSKNYKVLEVHGKYSSASKRFRNTINEENKNIEEEKVEEKMERIVIVSENVVDIETNKEVVVELVKTDVNAFDLVKDGNVEISFKADNESDAVSKFEKLVAESGYQFKNNKGSDENNKEEDIKSEYDAEEVLEESNEKEDKKEKDGMVTKIRRRVHKLLNFIKGGVILVFDQSKRVVKSGISMFKNLFDKLFMEKEVVKDVEKDEEGNIISEEEHEIKKFSIFKPFKMVMNGIKSLFGKKVKNQEA